MFSYVVIALLVTVFVVSFVRMRSGGPGPGVNYFPRRMRPGINAFYERRGWQAPYDEDGNRKPDRGSL